MSDTPETDAAIKASGGDWSPVLRAVSQRLERERDKAIRQFENLKASSIHTCHDQCQRPMCVLRRERDEAREALRELWQTADAYIPQIDEEQSTKWHNAMALHTTLQKVK
jgi:hypothetical protein